MSLSGSWQAAKVIPEFIKFCCCCNVKVVVPREGAASCPSLVPEQVTGVLFCPSTSVYLFPGLVMSVLNPQPPTEGFSGIIGGFISGGCAESTHTKLTLTLEHGSGGGTVPVLDLAVNVIFVLE